MTKKKKEKPVEVPKCSTCKKTLLRCTCAQQDLVK